MNANKCSSAVPEGTQAGNDFLKQGIWGMSPSPGTEIQSLMVLLVLLLLCHLLEVSNGGGQELG